MNTIFCLFPLEPYQVFSVSIPGSLGITPSWIQEQYCSAGCRTWIMPLQGKSYLLYCHLILCSSLFSFLMMAVLRDTQCCVPQSTERLAGCTQLSLGNHLSWVLNSVLHMLVCALLFYLTFSSWHLAGTNIYG